MIKNNPSTKIEEFNSKKGILIIKDSYSLGETINEGASGDLVLTALIINTPKNKTTVKGLSVKILKSTQDSFEKSSFIDFDETDSLITAIDTLIQTIIDWGKIDKEYTEVIFETKDDFSIGFYQKRDRQKFFIRLGSSYTGYEYVFFNKLDSVRKIKTQLLKALEILKAN